jgi:multidrug resistance protein, MATE family
MRYPNKTNQAIRTEIKAAIGLAVPLATSQLAQAATGFVDTIMMGWMGQTSLAAGGLAAAGFMTLFVAGLGVTTSVTALVAEAQGAEQSGAEQSGTQPPGRIRQLTIQGLFLTMLVALVAMLILSQGEVILLSGGQSPTIAHLAQSYLGQIWWGYFPAIGFVTLRGVVSALGTPRITVVIAIGGLIFNTIAAYVLGFGKLGFGAMGLGGLAIATAITHWLMLSALLAYMRWHPKLRQYGLLSQWERPDGTILRELFRLGLPTGLAFASEVGLFSTSTFLMGLLGVAALAAHQIVFQTIAIIFMVPLGMSYATTIRVGQFLGQGDWVGLRRAAYVGMLLGGSFMAFTAMLLLVFPRSIISLYLDLSIPQNEAVVPIVTSLLVVAAISQIFDGIQTNAAGALRGLQDTKVPMFLSFGAFWLVGLSTGYLLAFKLGLGSVGLWIGQTTGIVMSAVLFVWRFQYLWQRRSAISTKSET